MSGREPTSPELVRAVILLEEYRMAMVTALRDVESCGAPVILDFRPLLAHDEMLFAAADDVRALSTAARKALEIPT